jgi:hypothetical protein
MGEIGDHHRDLKKHRKRQRQKKKKAKWNPPQRRCWDWIVVGGDYHYAKNRSSFKEYRRIKAKIGVTPVIGIGTVELQVERGFRDSSTRILVLEDVLHIPNAICNGFNSSLSTSLQCWSGTGLMEGKDESGQSLWHARRFFGLAKLVLVNNPEGESGIEKAKAEGKISFSLSLYVNEEERNKIEVQKMLMAERAGGASLRDNDKD